MLAEDPRDCPQPPVQFLGSDALFWSPQAVHEHNPLTHVDKTLVYK